MDPLGPPAEEPADQAPPAPVRWWGRLRPFLGVVFLVAGVTFLVVSFVNALDRAEGRVLPTVSATVVGFGLVVAGQVVGCRGWVTLLDGAGPSRRLAASFYRSQIGKYVPGGVVQIAGQVTLATEAGATPAGATLAFFYLNALFAAAGLLLAIGFVVAPTALPTALVALVVVLAVIAEVVVDRRVSLIAARQRLVPGRIRRAIADIPTQGVLTRARVAGLAYLTLNASAVTVLARSVDPDLGWLTGLAAYGLAYTIGLALIPVPSGVGVREAVLLAVVPTAVAGDAMITASVIHRLLVIGAEVVTIAGNWVLGRIDARASRTDSAVQTSSGT